MKITEVTDTPDDLCSGDYHILTFAETGFAVLSDCAKQFGLGWEIVEKFSERVNETDEAGSLHPKAPISAVPRHVIRDNNDPDKLANHIGDFLKANERHIKANRLVMDFRAGLAPFVTAACKKALKNASAGILVDVIIVTE